MLSHLDSVYYFLIGGYFMFLLSNAFVLMESKMHLHKVTSWVLIYWAFLCLAEVSKNWFPNLLTVVNMLDMMCVPTLIMLLRALTAKRKVDLFMIVVHESPYVVCILLYLIFNNLLYEKIALAWSVLYSLIYIPISYYVLRLYRIHLMNYYTNLDGHGLGWLTNIVFTVPFIFIFWIIMNFSGFKFSFVFYYISAISIWHYLLYNIRHQHVTPLFSIPQIESSMNGYNTDESYPFVDNLNSVCSNPHYFTNPNLTVDDVSRLIHVPRKQIIDYLMNEEHTSFYEYINNQRVDYAENLLRNSDYPIDKIAIMSGFNSTGSFVSFFKYIYFCLPSDYRKLGDKNDVSL